MTHTDEGTPQFLVQPKEERRDSPMTNVREAISRLIQCTMSAVCELVYWPSNHAMEKRGHTQLHTHDTSAEHTK